MWLSTGTGAPNTCTAAVAQPPGGPVGPRRPGRPGRPCTPGAPGEPGEPLAPGAPEDTEEVWGGGCFGGGALHRTRRRHGQDQQADKLHSFSHPVHAQGARCVVNRQSCLMLSITNGWWWVSIMHQAALHAAKSCSRCNDQPCLVGLTLEQLRSMHAAVTKAHLTHQGCLQCRKVSTRSKYIRQRFRQAETTSSGLNQVHMLGLIKLLWQPSSG